MHYNDQLRLLDSLVDSDEKRPDNTRVTFLESAVESVRDLRHVKISDNVLQAQLDSTRPISYRSYFDLLKDAAFHLDQATKRGNKIRRTNVHFSGPNDEDEHQNLSSDDPQVIQQEDVCSEPPEHLSYSVFQSHFQGSSTSNTQKMFLPKPIWEKLSKDQQQMIIDHNRSLPKSGSSHLPTPNKSPSLYLTNLHHNRQSNLSRCIPTNLMRALLTQPKLRPPLLTLYWQWYIKSLLPLMMMFQTSPRFFQLRGLDRSRSANATSSSMPITPTINWWTVVPMEALLVQICVSSTEPTARSTFQALTTMKVLVLMWSLLQPSSTPLWEKSLASSMNMPTLGRDHPSIHQVNLNGLRPMLMKNLSKLVVPNLSPLWMDILSLSSSRMVWPIPPPLEDPQIRTWTHIHMSSSHLLMNGTSQSLTMISHTLMDWTPVKSLTNLLVTPLLKSKSDKVRQTDCRAEI